MEMDITQYLKDTENSLRDFIAAVLEDKLGDNWVLNCGVSEGRLKNWTDRRTVEAKRQTSATVEERLIYYADFYDLTTILHKNWSGEFSQAFGDWKTMEVMLNILEKYRDPDAHRRELLPHQKHLIAGISGEIRNKIVRYRSKKETSDDYFPRIESVRDNLGNIWVPPNFQSVVTNHTLRVGDLLEFVVTATDPEGGELEYGLGFYNWQKSSILTLELEHKHISKELHINILIRSTRDYHAFDIGYDDGVIFTYAVLPKKDS